MMSNRYWSAYYLQPDETMKKAKDPELENYLKRKELKPSDAIEFINGICMAHESYPTLFFTKTKVEDFLNNKQSGNKEVTLSVYGNRGRANVGRKTSYASFYFDDDLVGPQFFQNIFDGRYLSEREGSELDDVTGIMNRKKEQFINKKELVCRIVERIWSYLEQQNNNCVVLYVGERETVECSLDWLREIYHFIPQQLRATIGFATNSSPTDVIRLMDKMPISIVTTMVPAGQWIGISNRIHCLDINQIEEGNEERIEQLRQLYQMYQENPALFEAKLAYAEVVAQGVSFQKMQQIADMILGTGRAFWWEDQKIGTVKELNIKCQTTFQYIFSDKIKPETRQTLEGEILRVLCERITRYPMRAEICESTSSYSFLRENVKGIAEVLDTIREARDVADTVNKEIINKLQIENRDLKEQKAELEKSKDTLTKYRDDLLISYDKLRSIHIDLENKNEANEKTIERQAGELVQKNEELNKILCENRTQKSELEENFKIIKDLYMEVFQTKTDDQIKQHNLGSETATDTDNSEKNVGAEKNEENVGNSEGQKKGILPKIRAKVDGRLFFKKKGSVETDVNDVTTGKNHDDENMSDNIVPVEESQLSIEQTEEEVSEDKLAFSQGGGGNLLEIAKMDFEYVISEIRREFNALKQENQNLQTLLSESQVNASFMLSEGDSTKIADKKSPDCIVEVGEEPSEELVREILADEEGIEEMHVNNNEYYNINEKLQNNKEQESMNKKTNKTKNIISNLFNVVVLVLLCMSICMMFALLVQQTKMKNELSTTLSRISGETVLDESDWKATLIDFQNNLSNQMDSMQENVQDMQEDVKNMQNEITSISENVSGLLEREKETESSVYNGDQRENTSAYYEYNANDNGANFNNDLDDENTAGMTESNQIIPNTEGSLVGW